MITIVLLLVFVTTVLLNIQYEQWRLIYHICQSGFGNYYAILFCIMKNLSDNN